MKNSFLALGQIVILGILVFAFFFLVFTFGKRPEVRYHAGELVFNQEEEVYECPISAVVGMTYPDGQPIPEKDWQDVLERGRYRPVPISEEGL